MRKLTVILAMCLFFMIVTSNINLQTNDDTQPVKDKQWKDYPLTVVNNTNMKSNGMKLLTPALMQKPKHVPTNVLIFAKGKVEDIDLSLIDEDGNNNYNDIGTDLIVIGKSPYAAPLSRVITINNKLFECKVTAKGDQISLAPYTGKTGILDCISNFKCPSKLDYAIFNSEDIYIDVSGGKNIIVPLGTYKLWLGYMQEGTSHVTVKQNEMKTIEVTDEANADGKIKPTTVNWGAAYKLDFQVSTIDEKVKIPYSSVKVFGGSDEEYFNFFPSLAPQIEIMDSKSQTASKGAFPGC
jgi:hypothetical protein